MSDDEAWFGHLVLALPEPVETAKGWMVAVRIGCRRPDINESTTVAAPVYIADLSEWEPSR